MSGAAFLGVDPSATGRRWTGPGPDEDRLAEAMAALRVGPGTAPDTAVGPLVNQEAVDKVGELVAEGHDRETVRRIEHLLYISEWKRHQAAPGVRLTPRAFWLDRRYPVVNRWRDRS